MKSIFSKAVTTAVVLAFLSFSLQAAAIPSGDTTKMSKMKMHKKTDTKMSKMKKKDKMAKDTMSKM